MINTLEWIVDLSTQPARESVCPPVSQSVMCESVNCWGGVEWMVVDKNKTDGIMGSKQRINKWET